MPLTVNFREAGLGDSAVVRDLWTRKDLGSFREKNTATVPQYGVVLLQGKRGT